MASDAEPDTVDDGGNERLLTLADGVVAIALTLLALDLKPELDPSASSGDLAHYLHMHAGQYGAFLLAFFLIAQYWLVHHSLMRGVPRTSEGVRRCTLLFLLGITLVPLTTFMVGDFANSLDAVLFAANIALVSGSLGAISSVIHRRGLDDRAETAAQRVERLAGRYVNVGIPVLVAVLVWPLGPWALWFFVLTTVADVPGTLLARRAGRGAAAQSSST